MNKSLLQITKQKKKKQTVRALRASQGSKIDKQSEKGRQVSRDIPGGRSGQVEDQGINPNDRNVEWDQTPGRAVRVLTGNKTSDKGQLGWAEN